MSCQNEVGQAFQPAGSPDFPVRPWGDWKVAPTGRQECVPDASSRAALRHYGPTSEFRLSRLCAPLREFSSRHLWSAQSRLRSVRARRVAPSESGLTKDCLDTRGGTRAWGDRCSPSRVAPVAQERPLHQNENSSACEGENKDVHKTHAGSDLPAVALLIL